MTRHKMFDGIEVECCMGSEFESSHGCACMQEERVLRAYSAGRYTEPMKTNQRKWCAEEADSAGEGLYRAEELESLSDMELAHCVLDAWRSYVSTHF